MNETDEQRAEREAREAAEAAAAEDGPDEGSALPEGAAIGPGGALVPTQGTVLGIEGQTTVALDPNATPEERAQALRDAADEQLKAEKRRLNQSEEPEQGVDPRTGLPVGFPVDTAEALAGPTFRTGIQEVPERLRRA